MITVMEFKIKSFWPIIRVIGCITLGVGLLGAFNPGPASARAVHRHQTITHHQTVHVKRTVGRTIHQRPRHTSAIHRRASARHRGAVSQTPTAILTVVTHTAAGFAPNRLTVPVGATVTFTNSSGQPVWVASNPHPTHTDYSSFDAGRPYSQSESYTFTFSKGGTFGYHNHLNPSQGASILVE